MFLLSHLLYLAIQYETNLYCTAPRFTIEHKPGEIHSDWREVIAKGVADKNLLVTLTSPNTSHEDSDDCGAIILGMEEKRPNWDKIGANMNNIRTKTLIKEADVVVVRFGEKYRQWNAAFDAGYAAALGKSIITLHPVSQQLMLWLLIFQTFSCNAHNSYRFRIYMNYMYDVAGHLSYAEGSKRLC